MQRKGAASGVGFPWDAAVPPPGWQGWRSGEKGANPSATSRQQQLFALPGAVGVRLITQQAGGLRRDISGKQELQQSSNILMSRGIATVGQSSN